MASALAAEHFWVDKSRFDQAERQYYEILGKLIKDTVVKKNVECSVDNCVIDCPPPADTPVTRVAKPDKPLAKGKKSAADLPAQKKLCENEKAEVVMETPKSNKKNKKKNKGYNKKQGGSVVAVATAETKETPPAADATAVAGGAMAVAKTPPASNDKTVKPNAGPKTKGTVSNSQSTLVSEIAKAREHIKNSLEKMDGIASLAASPVNSDVLQRLNAVEKENANLKSVVDKLNSLYLESQKRLSALESQLGGKPAAAPVAAAPQKSDADDDDGVDLFASDDEEESAEAAKIREERLAAYAAKKSKKPALIAKSSLVLDVKPWDDETDLKLMEAEIRKITCDGLLWGASKFVPVAFGIQKLSISCVVEDEKVSIDWLTEEIEKYEDYVQSVDVAAFNKI